MGTGPETKELWQRGQLVLVDVGESGNPQCVHFIARSYSDYS